MNILVIGNPTTVHDLKWTTAIKEISECNLFFLPAEANPDQRIENKMKESNIQVLKPLPGICFKNTFKIIKALFRVRRLIKKNNIDLIHSLFVVPYSFWGIVSKKPKIITCRGSDMLIMLPELLASKHIVQKVLGLLILKQVKEAKEITCTSQKLMKAANKISNNCNLHLIRTGVDVDVIGNSNNILGLPQELKGKKIIFSPRWIEPVYGHELQIEAFKLLPEEVLKKYIFVFVRYKTLKSEYVESILNQYKGIENLNFLCFNNLSLEQMYSIYNFSSLVLMSPHSDGTPNSALEAMTAKKPLIMSNLQYDEDLFLNTSLKITTRTPESFADLIIEAINNYDPGMIERGYEAVINGGNRMTEMKKIVNLYKKHT